MEHIAIMRKSWGLTQKILSGQKKIESRWYKFKRGPYKNIFPEEVVYFKESGGPINAKAQVEKVLYFEDLDSNKIKKILENYGKEICIPLSFAEKIVDKNYCILIFLKNVEEVKPFNIDKTGFGLMNAWITCENVDKLKK